MSGQLCLKWNNHTVALNKHLENIFMEDLYSDGTILCHGKFYPIHRFVLSMCSEYFEEIFKQCKKSNNKYPFIVVKDILPEQMEALLNYMYQGEVNVPQDMLPELIKAAEVFKIKGLAVPDEEPATKQSKKRRNSQSIDKISKIIKNDPPLSNSDNLRNTTTNLEEEYSHLTTFRSEMQTEHNLDFATEIPNVPKKIKVEPSDELDEISICNNIKTEDTSNQFINKDHANSSNDVQIYESTKDLSSEYEEKHFDPNEELFDDQQAMTWEASQELEINEENDSDLTQRDICSTSDHHKGLKGTLKSCTYSGCSYQSSYPSLMKIHCRKHTGEKPFKCPQCDYCAAQKNNLITHLRRVHQYEKPYICSHCPFQGADKFELMNHIHSFHSNNDLVKYV